MHRDMKMDEYRSFFSWTLLLQAAADQHQTSASASALIAHLLTFHCMSGGNLSYCLIAISLAACISAAIRATAFASRFCMLISGPYDIIFAAIENRDCEA